jgi:chromosomal replication initiation ATPase DnaA
MTPDRILRAVCAVYNLTPDALTRQNHIQYDAAARSTVVLLTDELLPGTSNVDLGRVLNRDRSTVYNLRAIGQGWTAQDPTYRRRLDRARLLLSTRLDACVAALAFRYADA